MDAWLIAELQRRGQIANEFGLIERAADYAFACLLEQFPEANSLSVWVGKGNNAADAYLLALRAHRLGLRIQLVSLHAAQSLQGGARYAHEQCVTAGLQVETFGSTTRITGAVIVDGLLGTGTRGMPREPFAQAIIQINSSHKPVLSIDVPSGLDASSGASGEHTIVAHTTTAFITRKRGLYTGRGQRMVGRLYFSQLDIGDDLLREAAEATAHLQDDNAEQTFSVSQCQFVPEQLPTVALDTYKHRQGHVLLIGGERGMPGAVAMAAEAALRVGAGLVSVYTRSEHGPILVGRCPELMVMSDGPINEPLDTKLTSATLVVLGPGLGRGAWGRNLYDRVEALSSAHNIPVILDADGLHFLAENQSWQGGPLVITPHAGEAAKLLRQTSAEIESNRFAAAAALNRRYHCMGVLKGPGSILFSSSQQAVCMHGNPGMATAGMGDVLSGTIGGLFAQAAEELWQQTKPESGRDEALFIALCNAVSAHSAAADRAAADVGQRSLLATDVIKCLPLLVSGDTHKTNTLV